MADYVLKYSHNIIEHLGLKLYQNKPTNVIAELVSNSWDAMAKNVYIDLVSSSGSPIGIIVTDDGQGMNNAEIINNWLVIAKMKAGSRTQIGKSIRKPMGRKGIGKLAPFGVAKKVELITLKDGYLNWLSLDYNDLTKNTDPSKPFEVYKPIVYVNNQKDFKLKDAEPFLTRITSSDLQKKLKDRVKTILNAGSGTIIFGHELSLSRVVTNESLKKSLGRRFTVTLNDPDFKVFINDEKLLEEDCFPAWGLRIPEEGKLTEKIQFTYTDNSGKEITELKEISYWVGFVDSASWSQDEAGIGIFAHGKLAQDRPFFFRLKGSEIFTRYMYGVIEADWIDELDEDVISTDRTTLNWEYPGFESFLKWGAIETRKFINQYLDHRKKLAQVEIEKLVDTTLQGKTDYQLTASEKNHLTSLITEVTPNVDLSKEDKVNFIEVAAKAWVHEPARKLIRNLWEETSRFDPTQFPLIVDRLVQELVPEGLSLGVMFSLRIYALTQLDHRIMVGNETQLQHLIEEFPWILNSNYEKFSARTSLKKLVDEAKQTGKWQFREAAVATPNDYKQPDVVFLGDAENNNIIVVELKGPDATVAWLEFNQLQSYMQYFQSRFPEANVNGYLIARGIEESVLKQKPSTVEFKTWSQILMESRKEHMQILATILAGHDVNPSDPRVQQICQLGGEAVQDFLGQMAKNNEELDSIMRKLQPTLKTQQKVS
ncbi:DNA mismatch repair protein [Acinetobacter baumannii]|nr:MULTISPECIES: ATP-binding protein [Acinetobacter]ELB2470487.1 ATP-binding protein [Acinetobacter baumannii]ELN4298210.1 ATP-binding protein [Acinetobacter baumannii]MBD0078382.1 ATP-binding protein [Acinetobacter baumannii]MBP4677502.1 ATP-binding protein [Acinetobacter baumannii]MBP5038811.1 ATP-binding protein [Acinetobacter baumannii]